MKNIFIFIVFALGAFTCVFNNIVPIGIENIYLTALSMLGFQSLN